MNGENMKHRNMRAITPQEKASIEVSWIRRIRRSNLFLGAGIIIFAALAYLPEKLNIYALIAAFLIFTLFCSYRDLQRISRDIHNGTAEEIMGFVYKKSRFEFINVGAFLGPMIHGLAWFIHQFINSMSLKNGTLSFTLFSGHSLVLVRHGRKETICVDADTYGDLGNGALITASVLPGSRLAFKVKRTRLDTV
jgi:hypothetical protein